MSPKCRHSGESHPTGKRHPQQHHTVTSSPMNECWPLAHRPVFLISVHRAVSWNSRARWESPLIALAPSSSRNANKKTRRRERALNRRFDMVALAWRVWSKHGEGIEPRVQLEFRDLRFVELIPMNVPSDFLALLIEGSANYRRRIAAAMYPESKFVVLESYLSASPSLALVRRHRPLWSWMRRLGRRSPKPRQRFLS